MTLRQKLVLKDIGEALKKTNKKDLIITKIMRKNGYAESSCKTGATRKFIQEYTKKLDFFDPEKIKKDINSTFKLAKKKEDITNMARINEHRTKIAGMIVDKTESNTPADTINIIYSKPDEKKVSDTQQVVDTSTENKSSTLSS